MSLITNEYNYQRKSHRVDLPLLVEISGQQYTAVDWSLGGVGIISLSLDSVKNKEKIPARIILPMPDSIISLQVFLGFVSQHGEKTGLKFVDLLPKHRRVLRHYIELSIEGKLEDLEDLVTIVSSPQIATPIQEALNLSDLEEDSLVQTFRQRSYLSIILALLFFAGAAGTIFYNTVYRIKATGLISGTIRPVSAGCNGTVTNVFVSPGDTVKTGQELFTVEDKQSRALPDKTDMEIADIQDRLDHVSSNKIQQNTLLLDDLQKDYEENRRIFNEAKLLFKEGGITRKDLHLAKSYSLRSKVTLNRFLNSYKDRYEQQQFEIVSLTMKRDRLQQQLLDQPSEPTVCNGISPVAGDVFTFEKNNGEYVKANETMGLINMDTTPIIVIKLRSTDAIKIEIGMPASVYAPSLKTKYEATVAAIGYSAISGNSTLTLEASLNETLIKLTFVDPAVRFPVNSRVGVWIKTF